MREGTIIYRIGVSLSNEGFRKKITPIEAKETGKSYVGEGYRIGKNKLMVVDTMFIEKHDILKYFTFCLEGQQEEAIQTLTQHIKNKVLRYKKEIDSLIKYIE